MYNFHKEIRDSIVATGIKMKILSLAEECHKKVTTCDVGFFAMKPHIQNHSKCNLLLHSPHRSFIFQISHHENILRTDYFQQCQVNLLPQYLPVYELIECISES